MESWQTDILAALKAGSGGLESAQGEFAIAYRAAVAHIGLTDAAMSETRSLALKALHTTLERPAHLNRARPGSDTDTGDLVLDLLYVLTPLELLKNSQEAIASALEGAWAEATTGSEPFQPVERESGLSRRSGMTGTATLTALNPSYPALSAFSASRIDLMTLWFLAFYAAPSGSKAARPSWREDGGTISAGAARTLGEQCREFILSGRMMAVISVHIDPSTGPETEGRRMVLLFREFADFIRHSGGVAVHEDTPD